MDEDRTSVWRAVETRTIDDLQKAIYQIRSGGSFTGPYVSYRGGDGETSPLYEAVLLNDAEKVRLLIDCGADIHSGCEEGYPLQVAEELYEKNGNTHLKVFEILDESHDAFEYQSKYGGDERMELSCS